MNTLFEIAKLITYTAWPIIIIAALCALVGYYFSIEVLFVIGIIVAISIFLVYLMFMIMLAVIIQLKL